MLNKGLLAISAMSILSLSTPVLAFVSSPFGFYADGNLGYSDVRATTKGGSSSNTTGVGLNANVGYKFNPFLGGEVGFNAYQNTYIRMPNGKKVATISLFNFDVAGKGIVPFGATGFELFGKLGIQRTSNRITIENQKLANVLGVKQNTNFTSGLYLAAGLQYAFSPTLAGYAQWSRAIANNGNIKMDIYGAGISWMPGWFL